MRVAVLVHNEVYKDARVIKEATTLSKAGFEVQVHGISTDARPKHGFLPGTTVEVLLSPRLATGLPDLRRRFSAEPLARRLITALMILLPSFCLALLVFAVHGIFESSGWSQRVVPAAPGWLPGLVSFLIALIYLIILSGAFWRNRTKIIRTRNRLSANITDPEIIIQAIYFLIGVAASAFLTIAIILPFIVFDAALGAIWLIALSTCAAAAIFSLGYAFSFKALKWLQQVKEMFLRMPIGTSAMRHSYERSSAALLHSVSRRPRPDVIHIHDHVALTAARHLQVTYNCPIIWDAHEIYEDLAMSDPQRGMLNASIIEDNQDVVSGFITINESIARFYQEKYKKLPAPVVIMNATRHTDLPEYDGRLHETANLPIEKQILLFQGGFAAARGLPELIAASSHLNPEWELVLMGWGKLEPELRALASDVEAETGSSRVTFLPGVPQEELQLWTAGASVGAIPYRNIGLNHLYCTPNKLWEYPNAGVPILCSDLEEMARVVRRHQIGFVIPREFEAADIAECVNATNSLQLSEMRKRCREFIRQNDWSIYEADLISLYHRTAGKSPRVSKVKLAS